jgi:hypothetical protein
VVSLRNRFSIRPPTWANIAGSRAGAVPGSMCGDSFEKSAPDSSSAVRYSGVSRSSVEKSGVAVTSASSKFDRMSCIEPPWVALRFSHPVFSALQTVSWISAGFTSRPSCSDSIRAASRCAALPAM